MPNPNRVTLLNPYQFPIHNPAISVAFTDPESGVFLPHGSGRKCFGIPDLRSGTFGDNPSFSSSFSQFFYLFRLPKLAPGNQKQEERERIFSIPFFM
jgi:hypothetical protein